MIKERKYIVMGIVIFFLCCLSLSISGEYVSGEAPKKTVSITEFYNGSIYGDAYRSARWEGAVVTISSAEEMRIFFKCLYDFDWTYGISFRQEADISFSDCTFDFDSDSLKISVDGERGHREHYGVGMSMATVQSFGLEDAYFELGAGRDFWGNMMGRDTLLAVLLLQMEGFLKMGGFLGI